MSSLSISKKLFAGVGALALATLLLGVSSVTSLRSANARFDRVSGVTQRRLLLTLTLRRDAAEISGLTRGMVLRVYTKDDAAQQLNLTKFAATMSELRGALSELDGLVYGPESKAAIGKIHDGLDQLGTASDTLIQVIKAGDLNGAINVLDSSVRVTQAEIEAQTEELLKIQDQISAEDRQAQATAARETSGVTVFLTLFSLATAVVVLFVVRQIHVVLRQSVDDLSQSSDQMASAAQQVSSSSQALAQGASRQAATIEETSSASAEINSMAQRNSENSRSTTEIVTNSQAGFERTNHSLTEMVAAMENISGSSQKISKIIKVIDEIAFQTNILALNAAVEAARAGEAGMGFAVVADEVRSLAQRCAQAAKDTEELIADSIQKSDGGKAKVDDVAAAIRDITAESAKIKVLVDEINLGSSEQSRGIDQISRSITQMEQVTQSNAANAEQTAAAAEQLSAQAHTLRDVVDRLRNLADGTSGSSPKVAQPTRRTTPPHPTGKPSNAMAKIATIKTSVSFPRTPAPAHAPAPAPATGRKHPVEVSANHFPMDDDFKEF